MWLLTLAITSALFILEDVLQLTKDRANSVIPFYNFMASLPSLKAYKKAHRKATRMRKPQKESEKEYSEKLSLQLEKEQPYNMCVINFLIIWVLKKSCLNYGEGSLPTVDNPLSVFLI